MQIIKIVSMNKANGQKYVTIPKHCNINEGDEVEILKVIKD